MIFQRLPNWWSDAMFPANGSRAGGLNSRSRTLLLLLLLTMTCVLFFAGLDHPLLEPEEARYAEIPRQMLVEGRLLTPVLHGEDYWQKPPLLYWLVMLSYRIFGVHDWAARLVPCLAAVLSVAITTGWGCTTLGFWGGWVSGLILALSARFLYLAGMLSMDGILCTCVLAGLACGHRALVEDGSFRRRSIFFSALACALGILAKGPVALVLISVPLAAFAFLDRRSRFLSPRESVLYLGIVAVVAGPWFVVMILNAPGAAGSFFWLHHFVRYFAPFDHEKPAWFYLPSLLIGMLPWTFLLIPLVPYLVRQTERAGRRRPAALGVFVLAFIWCVLFFSLSGCKRAGYILPALPLLALILGSFVTHGFLWRRWMRRGAIIAGGTFLALYLGQSLWMPDYHDRFGFGIRRQVELTSVRERAELPIVCYPRRWDSVSFYTQRNDVESCAMIDLPRLLRDLQAQGKGLIFVRQGSVRDLLQALPPTLQIEWRGASENHVVVALVQLRNP